MTDRPANSRKPAAKKSAAPKPAAKKSAPPRRRASDQAPARANGLPAPIPPAEPLGLPFDPAVLPGYLIVIEGPDGSGRSTQIALLTEWIESSGFAVQTIGLRRSHLLAKNIDVVMAKNQVGPMALALMYATDLYDQLENVMMPALRAGHVVLADRYAYTLMARAAVRGIDRDYLRRLYSRTLRPHLTFWLNPSPEVAFQREFRKSNEVSFWESGRDLHLSNDLFESFVKYQILMRDEFAALSEAEGFVELAGAGSIREINLEIRKRVARLLRIRTVQFKPSQALMPLWVE